MAAQKNETMAKMSNDERTEKVKELRMELMKERVNVAKGGKIKIREMKRTIAKLLTFNRQNKSIENK